MDHDALLKLIVDFLEQHHSGEMPFDYFQKLSLVSFFYLFHAILSSVDVAIEPFDLLVETDLTVSAGTGSSASFLVCVAAICYQYVRLKVKNRDNISKNGYKPCSLQISDLNKFEKHELELISKWAYCAERIIHGTPSGVDNTVCTYGSLVEFSKSAGAKKLDLPLKFKILLVNTKVGRNTKAMTKRVFIVKEKYGTVIDLVLEALDNVAKEALKCFKEYSKIHTHKEEIEKLYEKLGVSNSN